MANRNTWALWRKELQQKLLTQVANRSFKQNPNLLDKLAMRLIEKAYGPVTEDPELEHSPVEDLPITNSLKG